MSLNVTLDGKSVDMQSKDLPAFTYGIEDPSDPTAYRGMRSTLFKAPATLALKSTLGGAAISERPPTADPELIVGNAGSPFVRSRIRPIEWDRDETRCIAVGNNASWFTELKATKIRSLDLGVSDPVNAANMTASWADEDAVIYYPLIDYGYDWDTTTLGATITSLRPAIRCHRILSKAFNDLGYSLKVDGRLNRKWKKFFLPNTNTKLQVAQVSLDFYTSEFQSATPALTQVVTGEEITQLPNIVSDPSGAWVTPGLYSPDVSLTATVTITATFNFLSPSTLVDSKIVNFVGGLAIVINSGTQLVYGLGPQTISITYVNVPMFEAQSYGFFMEGTTGLQPQLVNVRIVPTNIEYQEGVQLDNAKCAPNLSVLDVIKSIGILKRLVIRTNDTTKTVTVQYADDFYRPHEVAGIDMRGREDHTDAPVKKSPLREKEIHFKWKEDSKDALLEALNEDIGERTYGGHVHSIPAGVLDPKKVELPFAATAMKMEAGGCFIPAMRESVTLNTTQYEWQPRILIADGMARGSWEFDGNPLNEYPRSFFVFPDENELGLSFGLETAYGSVGPGTIANYWIKTLRRSYELPRLSIDLQLYDYELADMDFGSPRLINDGHESGWFFFGEITQKRYGIDEPTRCEMLPE